MQEQMDRALTEAERESRAQLFAELLPMEEALARAACAELDPDSGLTLDADHTTLNVLFPFEVAAVLATRVAQLDAGAPSFLPGRPYVFPVDHMLVAQKELRARLLPFVLQRRLAPGRFEYFALRDMQVLEELEVDCIDFDAVLAHAHVT